MLTLIRHSLRIIALAVLVGLSMVSMVWAADSATRAPVTQSYGTDDTLQKGMLVRLDSKDSTKVSILKQDESDRMLGLVVAANDAALSLTSDLDKRQVYVASFGKYNALVSTQNGPIKIGDLISISTLNGIGMKADGEEKMVLGKALTAFDGSDAEGTASLTNSEGDKTTVSLGRINVQVSVQSNPLQSAGLPSALTQFLSDIGYSVTKKNVSVARLYLATLILLVASIVSGVMLFSSVRSTLVSIGRNPLAKQAIVRSMFQVVITSLIIFIIGVFGVYLLLKL